jgi:hypothetical protein
MSLFMIENIIFLKIFTKETNTHRYLMLLFFILTFFGSKNKNFKEKKIYRIQYYFFYQIEKNPIQYHVFLKEVSE